MFSFSRTGKVCILAVYPPAHLPWCFAVLDLQVACWDLPNKFPASPLKPVDKCCDAVKDVVKILRLNREAAGFCNSVLHITPATRVITATATPHPATITRTVVGTNTAVVTEVDTSAQEITETIVQTATYVELVRTSQRV